MASLHNLAISMLRIDGITNIPQAVRHHTETRSDPSNYS